MSWFDKIANDALRLETLSEVKACEELSQFIPKSFTLNELAEAARGSLSRLCAGKPNRSLATSHLLTLLACTRCQGRFPPRPSIENRNAVRELVLNVTKVVAPVVAENKGQTGASGHPGALAERCSSSSILTSSPIQLDDQTLYLLMVYAGSSDQRIVVPSQVKAAASRLLAKQFTTSTGNDNNNRAKEEPRSKTAFITETVLQSYLRPLFSRSRPATVTASGRKAAYPDQDDSGAGGPRRGGASLLEETAQTKPWKYTDFRAVPVLGWAVKEADSHLLATHWPLFTPFLLTLADEPASSPLLRAGLLMLSEFLAKLPAATLHATGLAQVFEDAIFPTLSALPSLTPEDESMLVLGPAYGALLQLARKVGQPTNENGDGGVLKKQHALLDKVLRDGVFMGYFHAKEHVRIVAELCSWTARILNELEVHAVKHLKDLIPMLSAILTDPFGPSAPETLLAAVKALQAVLTNCWPRILGSPWQDEIINALVLCWLHVLEQEGEEDKELRLTARAVAAVLKTARKQVDGGEDGKGNVETDLGSYVAPLVAKDPRLTGLFGPPSK
ncbi:uncharacterized protein C8A04DRAFT_34607 [Dichotomopilus funicola]|uniref:Uncharacterized protein n=1 Tax=Dichotomopilus funicola TaxID=1934379 RepID=A0AAN6VAS7_9PEZI|nr:hypothetical protein C8A04DRAFT_34607 [Dichotomopilus funicola]